MIAFDRDEERECRDELSTYLLGVLHSIFFYVTRLVDLRVWLSRMDGRPTRICNASQRCAGLSNTTFIAGSSPIRSGAQLGREHSLGYRHFDALGQMIQPQLSLEHYLFTTILLQQYHSPHSSLSCTPYILGCKYNFSYLILYLSILMGSRSVTVMWKSASSNRDNPGQQFRPHPPNSRFYNLIRILIRGHCTGIGR